MVVSRRLASACCSCSWSPARASSARTARRPPLWQDMQGPWRVPAKNVGTTPAEVRGIKKQDDGRRMPRLVYGLVYKGLSALPGLHPIYDYPANAGKMREPTSGLEPLT